MPKQSHTNITDMNEEWFIDPSDEELHEIHVCLELMLMLYLDIM